MPLIPLDDADDWSSEIYEAVVEAGMFDGEVRIIVPGKPGTYDPVEDEETGATADQILIDWRPGRAQHLSSPLEINDGNGWATKRRYLFQMENRPADPAIPRGAVVRFRGGKDHTLAAIAFQVTSGVGSSSAALRTIRATTEAGVSAT